MPACWAHLGPNPHASRTPRLTSGRACQQQSTWLTLCGLGNQAETGKAPNNNAVTEQIAGEGKNLPSDGEGAMNDEPGTARIVELAPGDAGAGFFLIPGTGGKIEGFAILAGYLDIPMPVFAIEARGLDKNSLPDSNVEEMTQHYLALVRSVQPAGPYFLLGHSFGGLVALEMAQRLTEAGEKIACLIMLDTPTPEKYWPLSFRLRTIGAKIRRHVTRLSAAPLKENFDYYWRKMSARRVNLNDMPPDAMIGSNVVRVMIAHTIARKQYRPKFYAGKVTFFRPLEMPSDYELLWRNRVGDLEIHATPGDHLSMVEPPHAPFLAAKLSTCVISALNPT